MVPYRPSAPLRAWRGPRRALLDGLAASATSPPLREAYVVRVVAEFQGFARDLHDEAVVRLVTLSKARAAHHGALRRAATAGRRLDATNPSLETLERDFARLGLHDLERRLKATVPHWPAVERQLRLLLDLRNAVAHGDERGRVRVRRRGAVATLAWVGRTRSHLDTVANAIDHLLWDQLERTFGREPW